MKKLAILGSSNAMMNNGYGKILKSSNPEEVDIYAFAGNSISFATHMILEHKILDKYENVILDFNLNSSNMINCGVSTKCYLVGHLKFIIDNFKKSNSRPIFLISPDLSFDIINSHSYIFRSMAHMYNISYIDIEDEFKNFSRSQMIKAEDPAHFFPDKQEIIASRILDSINDKKLEMSNKESSKINFYLFLNDNNRNCFNTKVAKTCLGTFEYFELPIDFEITIPIYIVGISFWSHNKTPFLNIKNNSINISKNLNIVWEDYFFYRDIGYSIEQGIAGGIVSAKTSSEGSLLERTIHEKNSDTEYDDRLYINNLLLCDKQLNIFGMNYLLYNRAIFNKYYKELFSIVSMYEAN